MLKTAITPLALLAPTLRGLVPMREKSGASGDPAGAQRNSAARGPAPPPVPPAGSGCERPRGHPSSFPARLPSLQVYRARQPCTSEPQVWSGQLWSHLDGAASKAGTARWPQLGRQWAIASGLEGQAGGAPGLGAGRQGSAAPRPTMPETEGARWAGDEPEETSGGPGGTAERALCDLREGGSWRRKGSIFKCNLEGT